MAVDDSGKRARLLPCLAILRYTVATVVTVLAVVVIVMVIAVGVRPGDVSVSVVQGHVRAVGCIDGYCFRVNPYSEFGSCSGFRGCTRVVSPTRTVYNPPLESLSFRVSLSVDNPSGRAGIIYCTNITVSLFAGTAAAGREIGGRFHLMSDLNFQLMPQTSHKISRLMAINDTATLEYIADRYVSSFTGTVVVTMNTSSVVLSHHSTSSIVKFVCWPVYFSVSYATGKATQCEKSN